MPSWFKEIQTPKIKTRNEVSKIPQGVWVNCSRCREIIHKEDLKKHLFVCVKCNYHFRVSAYQRVEMLLDKNSFQEYDQDLTSPNPLNFEDSMTYEERLQKSEKKTGLKDAIVTGYGTINGGEVLIGAFDFSFMGGSMGLVVGDKIARLFEKAILTKLPVIIISSSGGARMQEGIISLMQMAKTLALLSQFRKAKRPFISVLTDPTTGGVAASFAMRGDIILAEPEALIGFAGPRVIEQTIKQKLPQGFQRAEFLLEHGMIDMIVDRTELKTQLSKLIKML
ncbi:MAG: acetyl-CoA carboxylase carboxyltransferase subunit beta [Deltaproteobacteria bacterium]|nr:acetyl-CoA carboxylase carboxyltransferase subunit beta [Deltaproteobacteria bacterium]